MDDKQKKYYHEMLERDRGYIFIKDNHVAAVVTFFVGDEDDEKYLFREPWTIVDDDPYGTTLYIDQLLVKDHSATKIIHKEFAIFLAFIKEAFPTIQRAKWVRVNAQFRKHGIKEGVKSNVHIKNLK